MSSASPEPLDPSFRIELPEFEGPLDLLLHLIQKHELNILDLPVAFVTERYLAHITLMKELDLDVASEYLVMAALLVHIKSRMLLPPSLSDEADELVSDETDPRSELIRRLLEYQKYKHAAEDIGGRKLIGRDVFLRHAAVEVGEEPDEPLGWTVFQLLEAFQRVVERTRAELAFQVTPERITIQERIRQIMDELERRPSCVFDSLFDEARTTYDIVVTFLAILEMTKVRMIHIYQTGPGAPIYLENRVVKEDVVTDEAARPI